MFKDPKTFPVVSVIEEYWLVFDTERWVAAELELGGVWMAC